MTDYGLVSIITPNYNCAAFIGQTIESVQVQTYQNWEMLIQDDCSTDDSMEVAKRYASSNPRIKIERNSKNSGAAITRNNAIKRSKGRWLAFLDSDDLWVPQKLEKQLTFMVNNQVDFSFTEYEKIDELGNKTGVLIRVINKLTYNKLLMHNWPGCLTVIYKQDLSNKIYGPNVKKSNDRTLFLKVIRNCNNIRGIKENLAFYRVRGGSISHNKKQMIKPFVEIIHKIEGKSIVYAYFCLFTHVFIKKFFKEKKLKKS